MDKSRYCRPKDFHPKQGTGDRQFFTVERILFAMVVVLVICFNSVLPAGDPASEKIRKGIEKKMAPVKVGEVAPQFTVTSHQGKEIRLKDFLNKKVVVLFFYPADNTTICTKEACQFRDQYEDFNDAGAEVIGVSSDSNESHEGFASKNRLPFPLLADEKGDLRKSFGVPNNFGFIPGRVTYVIDMEGIVQMVFQSQLSADDHVKNALKKVKELSQKPKE